MLPFEEEKRVLENSRVPMFLMKCKAESSYRIWNER